jgi:hypothetical protein
MVRPPILIQVDNLNEKEKKQRERTPMVSIPQK